MPDANRVRSRPPGLNSRLRCCRCECAEADGGRPRANVAAAGTITFFFLPSPPAEACDASLVLATSSPLSPLSSPASSASCVVISSFTSSSRDMFLSSLTGVQRAQMWSRADGQRATPASAGVARRPTALTHSGPSPRVALLAQIPAASAARLPDTRRPALGRAEPMRRLWARTSLWAQVARPLQGESGWSAAQACPRTTYQGSPEVSAPAAHTASTAVLQHRCLHTTSYTQQSQQSSPAQHQSVLSVQEHEKACWDCKHHIRRGSFACQRCEKIQPADPSLNYFELLGM